MARSRFHRLTALMLLMTFSVANIAGGLLHHHGHQCEHQHGSHCQHSHAGAHEHVFADDDHHSHGHGAAVRAESDHRDVLAVTSPAVTSPAGHSLVDDDCSACRFVGQRTLVPLVSQAGTISAHSVELAVRYASQSGVSIARTLHSRAPPAIG